MLEDYLRDDTDMGWRFRRPDAGPGGGADPYGPDPLPGDGGGPPAPVPAAGGGPVAAGPAAPGPGGPVFPSYPINPYGGFGDPAPEFDAPDFANPDPQALLNDPAYRFRLEEGQRALNASAAAKGVLHTGGTLRDLVDYGQNFASQEYNNFYNRALQAYDRDFQAAASEYESQYGPWALRAGQDFGAWEAWLDAQLRRQGLLNDATFGGF